MNIFEIPLYYISFNKKNELENDFKDNGFKNINFFKAIRGSDYNIEDLLDDKKITLRSYNDLVTKSRHEHSSIPSIGAIGCAMSHISLWEKCVKNNLEYMIIAEDDVDLSYKLKKEDIEFIQKVLEKPNSVYISPLKINYLNGKPFSFFGLHFYIIRNDACKKLLNGAYPIDIQIDLYMGNLMYRKIINAELKIFYGQKLHMSAIQDICIKCFMPTSLLSYLIILVLIGLIVYYYYNRAVVCERIMDRNNF